MKTIKGPAIFLAQFAGDKAPFNSLDAIAGWAASLGYKGVQIPTWDARFFDLEKAAESQDLLRRGQGDAGEARRRDHRAVDPPAGPARRRAPGLRRGLRRLRATGGARQPEGAPGMGGAAGDAGGEGLAQPRPRRARHLQRRAGLALSLSLAAAARGPDRDRLRRAGATLEARSSMPSTSRASTSATRSIPARTCSTVPPSRCSSTQVGGHPRCQHQLRPVALRAAGARLSGLHRHLPRAHQGLPRQGRRAQPDGRQGVYSRLPGLDRTAPGASARWATGRSISPAIFSKLDRSTAMAAGRCWSGNAASSTPRTARARAPSSSPPTSSA